MSTVCAQCAGLRFPVEARRVGVDVSHRRERTVAHDDEVRHPSGSSDPLRESNDSDRMSWPSRVVGAMTLPRSPATPDSIVRRTIVVAHRWFSGSRETDLLAREETHDLVVHTSGLLRLVFSRRERRA
jgi:hypothetical protein